MMGNSSEEEGAGLPEEDPVFLRTRLTEVEALYAQVQVQFRELRTWYDKLKRQHRELLWSDVVLERVGLSEAAPGPAIADADRANGHIGGGFVLRHHVGGGAFATVFSGTDADGRPCAVKRIPKYRIRTLDSLKNVAGELHALRAAVGCPNLVGFRGVVASEVTLSFAMELFGNSNLQDAIAARPNDVTRAAPGIIRGLANGLAHMHARDLHHRDIKPENVLFDGSEVKLCDFGLTATWQRDPVTNERLRFPQCVSGTMGFFAPEMLATTGYDGPSADVWSLGVVALEVLIGIPNFDASWFVAYKRETDNGNLLLGQRQTIAGVVPDQDKYAHFRGVLGPIVDSIVDRGTTLGRLVSRDTTNAQVAAECSGMLRLDPTLRPTAASIRDALTTKTVVTEL